MNNWCWIDDLNFIKSRGTTDLGDINGKLSFELNSSDVQDVQ